METLPQAEFQVMQALWSGEPPLTTRTVMESLVENKKWKIQTVSTLLSRLTKRGFLSSTRHGRELRYQILVSRDDYFEYETATFAGRYNDLPITDLVSAFTQDNLSKEDIDELSAWLAKRKPQTEKN